MAGLLTAAQSSAIPNGRFRHKWSIVRPDATSRTIHDDDGGPSRVTHRGQRSGTLYNVSMQEPGDLSAQEYQITARNIDGILYSSGASSYFFDGVSIYYAPTECFLKHEVWIWSAGAWSELPCSPWVGKIKEVSHDDVLNGGSWAPGSSTIKAEGVIGQQVRQVWTPDHGYDVENATPITPSGFLVHSITTGWDYSAPDYRIWVQFSTTASCSSTATFRPSGLAWSVGTGSTSSTTLHQISINAASGNWGQYLIFLKVNNGTLSIAKGEPDVPIVRRSNAQTARPW